MERGEINLGKGKKAELAGVDAWFEGEERIIGDSLD